MLDVVHLLDNTRFKRFFLRSFLDRRWLTIISGILFRHKGFSIYYPENLFSHRLRAQREVCEVILGVVGNVVCFTIFSGNSFWKKRFLNLLHQFAHVHHHIFVVIYCMLRFFGCLISKFLGFGFKARGLRDTCHQRFIFQICRKIRIEDSWLNWLSTRFY
jgi:hypothetical protein